MSRHPYSVRSPVLISTAEADGADAQACRLAHMQACAMALLVAHSPRRLVPVGHLLQDPYDLHEVAPGVAEGCALSVVHLCVQHSGARLYEVIADGGRTRRQRQIITAWMTLERRSLPSERVDSRTWDGWRPAFGSAGMLELWQQVASYAPASEQERLPALDLRPPCLHDADSLALALWRGDHAATKRELLLDLPGIGGPIGDPPPSPSLVERAAVWFCLKLGILTVRGGR